MIYVGVLAELLGIDEMTVEAAIGSQFKRKPSAVTTNMDAARLGFGHAREHLTKRDRIHARTHDGRDRRTDLHGRQPRGRARMSSWAAARLQPGIRLRRHRRSANRSSRLPISIASNPATGEKKVAIVQAEDELAAIGMVFGAGWAGARAMTSTSGPGLSLMAEWAGYGYYAEVPGVIFDVQRAGPSTGLADAHDAGRRRVCLSSLARRYETHRTAAGDGARSVRDGDGRIRSRRSFPDAHLRAFGSRSRDELMDDQAASVSGTSVRPRQSTGRKRLEPVGIVGTLSRRRS